LTRLVSPTFISILFPIVLEHEVSGPVGGVPPPIFPRHQVGQKGLEP
jgi:hypothetical protein